MNLQALYQELLRDEEMRLKPYVDTVGKLTIGCGRNLTDNGVSLDEAMEMLNHDVTATIRALAHVLPWFPRLDPVRQRVLVNMAFNLGTTGLLKFTNTLAAVERGHYDLAAEGMLKSKWATQVGQRAERLAAMMRTGAVPTRDGDLKV